MLEVELSKHFADLDNRFDARLSAVLAVRRTEVSAETAGFSAKYECRVKSKYQRDLKGLLEEGMLLAVRNFKTATDNIVGLVERAWNPRYWWVRIPLAPP